MEMFMEKLKKATFLKKVDKIIQKLRAVLW